MHTHVYANGLEIACKAAANDGVSPSAFPDPCWSPPGPSAGPIVIPYPNTCYASSITNGTATISICGKEVAIEDKSRFDTSTGNEPATHAFKKGFRTGVITGDGYFTQWSFDVVFEGFGVPRHQDLVGHNHGSMPSNTAVFPYISRSWLRKHPCDKEEKRIERACQPENEQSEARREVKKNSRFANLLRGKGQSGGGKHWTDSHCGGLQAPIPDADAAKRYVDDMKEVFDALPDELNMMAALESTLKDMATDAAMHAAGKWALKAGAKKVAGTSLPVAGNVAMGLWSVVDAAIAIGDVNEIRQVATESLEKLDMLRSRASELQSMAGEFGNFGNLSPEEQRRKAQELATQAQDLLATLNDCTRARKCNLVPYRGQAGNLIGQRRNSKVEPSTGGGCCRGQTGHHLIYGAMAKDACPGYDRPPNPLHNSAPTVCVEGTSQNFGSHGRVHDAMDRQVAALSRNGRLSDGSMSMDQAIDSATRSHQEAFPASRCSADCIRAQLKAFYESACRNGRFKAVDKHGSAVGSDEADTDSI